jgi:hypothetical protein
MVGWADDDPPRRRRLASGLVSHGGGRPTAGRLIVNPDATVCTGVAGALPSAGSLALRAGRADDGSCRAAGPSTRPGSGDGAAARSGGTPPCTAHRVVHSQ